MSWADLVVGAIELAVNVGANAIDEHDRKARALETADAAEQAMQAQREADDEVTASGRFQQPQFVPNLPDHRFENPHFGDAADGNLDFEAPGDQGSSPAVQAHLP